MQPHFGYPRRWPGALVCCALLIAAAHAQTDDFTIVVLPDTQHYSKVYPHIFRAQTEWIARSASAENIQLVVGVGDIVDDGSDVAQWQNADAAVTVLDRAGIPYVLPLGNHDYDDRQPANRRASGFNAYFGPSRYGRTTSYRGSYPAGSNENFYSTFTLGGRAYLVMALEFIPRDAALQWASGVIAANSDKEVIVTTHTHLFSDDSYVAKCDPDSAATYGLQADNNGDGVWNKLLQQHNNISLVLSGHVTAADGTGRLSQIGLSGNLVNQVLSNYQTRANGGSGYLRILRIRPSLNRIEVTTYSPYLDSYLTDPENQFTLKHHNDSLGTAGFGYVVGRVRAHDCSRLAGIHVSIGDSSVQSDEAGLFRVPVLAPLSGMVAASNAAFHTAGEPVVVHSGYEQPRDIWMSAATATGGLHGEVTTSAGIPVASAAVSIVGGNIPSTRAAVSDTQGAFSAGTLPVGVYRVAVKVGKVTRVKDVSIVSGATTGAQFRFSTKFIQSTASSPPAGWPQQLIHARRGASRKPRAAVASPVSRSIMGAPGGSDEALHTASADRRARTGSCRATTRGTSASGRWARGAACTRATVRKIRLGGASTGKP